MFVTLIDSYGSSSYSASSYPAPPCPMSYILSCGPSVQTVGCSAGDYGSSYSPNYGASSYGESSYGSSGSNYETQVMKDLQTMDHLVQTTEVLQDPQ
uniref:VM domain-containing protein n=1 Tax=Megaselia scalaris TaxID=36166 RepID=T1GE92_MEGSC